MLEEIKRVDRTLEETARLCMPSEDRRRGEDGGARKHYLEIRRKGGGERGGRRQNNIKGHERTKGGRRGREVERAGKGWGERAEKG